MSSLFLLRLFNAQTLPIERSRFEDTRREFVYKKQQPIKLQTMQLWKNRLTCVLGALLATLGLFFMVFCNLTCVCNNSNSNFFCCNSINSFCFWINFCCILNVSVSIFSIIGAPSPIWGSVGPVDSTLDLPLRNLGLKWMLFEGGCAVTGHAGSNMWICTSMAYSFFWGKMLFQVWRSLNISALVFSSTCFFV